MDQNQIHRGTEFGQSTQRAPLGFVGVGIWEIGGALGGGQKKFSRLENAERLTRRRHGEDTIVPMILFSPPSNGLILI